MDDVLIPGRGVLAEVDVSDLEEPGAVRTFLYVNRFGQESEGFVMRWREGFVAFENRCPHWSIPLGYDDENFLGADRRDIVCPMHGARFTPETGECWEGPCVGDALERFDVEVRGSTVVIKRAAVKISWLG